MKRTCLLLVLFVLFAGLSAYAQDSTANKPGYWKIKGNEGTRPGINFIGTTDYLALIFKTNNLERMRISRNGNIGIGTANPKSKLSIDSGEVVSLTSAGYVQIGDASASNMVLDYNVIQARNDSAAGNLYLNSSGGNTLIGSALGKPFQVIPNGNVGIYGNAVSSYALNVNASSAVNGINVTDPLDNYVLYSKKSGINYGIYIEKTSTATGTACIEGYGNGFAIGVEGYSNNAFGISGYSGNSYGVNGFAGVAGGNTSVGVYGYGNYGVYGSTANNANYYAGYFVGDIYASSGVFVGSDLKLKQNIQDVPDAMKVISRLHPKQYQFRQDGNYKLMNLPAGQHYGLIAQEVEKVLPDLVKNSKFDTRTATAKLPKQGENETKENGNTEVIDFKALNYTELIPLMLKGMQEQQAVIQNQEQRITQLEQLVEKLSGNQFSVDNTINNAYLKQNLPNPFSQNTVIICFVPGTAHNARLIINDLNGKQVQTFILNKGVNNVTVNANNLSAGLYTYVLLIDGKQADSKTMSISK